MIDIGCETIAIPSGTKIEVECESDRHGERNCRGGSNHHDDDDECRADWRYGVLKIKSREAVLLVTATDDAGNVETCSIELCAPEEEPAEGCTPGYWKQSQHLDSWDVYRPDDKFDSVFGVDAPGNKTLIYMLKEGDALARHAVAALLNAANPEVNYAYSVAEVRGIVQEAFETGDWEEAKNLLEEQNEQGCPLN